MGLFCVNFHFVSADEKALSAALAKRGTARHRILPEKNGWTSLYDEQASEQDERRIHELAGRLSRDLNAAVVAFMVHDSDIACYWLYENGELLDEYNSCPGYFDQDEDQSGPSGGNADVLLRFCRPGVSHEELTAIFGMDELFAENIIERLADALGIDRGRAIADYRHDGGNDSDDDEAGDGDDGPPSPPGGKSLVGRLAGMLGGLGRRGADVDPQVQALVRAAANDDIGEIDRLLVAGVAVDAEAPAPLPNQPTAGLLRPNPGTAPQIPMTALLAAVLHKHRAATERLLTAGADLNRDHPIFGSAVHAAAGAGDVEMLRLLLDRGGSVNARNARGQTPLEVIALGRTTKERLAQVQAMMASMGAKMPGMPAQLADIKLPTEGWDACERLLKEREPR